MSLMLQNLAIYGLQVAILIAVGGLLPFAGRLHNVRARLAWWHGLLGACLLLPLIQPWKQTFIQSSMVISHRLPAAGGEPIEQVAIFPWDTVVLAVLAAGAALRLAWLAIGFLRLRAYLDRATLYNCPLARRMDVHAYVGLSVEITSPVTFGVRHPVILFPARFAEMDPAMQETIACHELLHVHRRDWLFAVAEEFIRAALWFHPGIWWLLGEIQLTREQVVDEEVVRLTQARQEYLNALLAIAAARPRLDLAPAPLFLRRRHLSQRVSQILKEVTMSRSRIVASLAGISSILLLAAVIVVRSLPLEAAPQVKDAPGVSVGEAEANLLHRVAVEYPPEARAKGIQGNVVLEVQIDETGAVSDARVISGPQELRKAALQSVLQWHYSKNMGLPAHTQVSVNFQLPPATVAESKPQPAIAPAESSAGELGVLKIIDYGSLPEELRNELQPKLAGYEGRPFNKQLMREIERTVSGIDRHIIFRWAMQPGQGSDRAFSLGLALNTAPMSAPGPMPAPAAAMRDQAPTADPKTATPQRIRVGGNVQQAMLVEQVRPIYPPAAKEARIQGVVRFNVIIGKDGTVQNISVDSGHPLLVPAALDAVKQWVYRPTLLNGEPVEVVTVVDVNFTLRE
jgi:TonB family protein